MDVSKIIRLIFDFGDTKDILRLGVKLNHLARLDEETISSSNNKFLDNHALSCVYPT